MDTVLRCVGIAVVGAILAVLTKKQGGEFTVLISIAAVTAIGLLAMGFISPILSMLSRMRDTAGLAGSLVQPVIKAMGIGFLTEIGTNLCEDAGEKTIGNGLKMAGTLAAVYVLMPLMESVMELIEQMI